MLDLFKIKPKTKPDFDMNQSDLNLIDKAINLFKTNKHLFKTETEHVYTFGDQNHLNNKIVLGKYKLVLKEYTTNTNLLIFKENGKSLFRIKINNEMTCAFYELFDSGISEDILK
jgi:hypothetical protein